MFLCASFPPSCTKEKWGLPPSDLYNAFTQVNYRSYCHMAIDKMRDGDSAAAAAAAAKSLQSCLTLCDPIDGSPPGSPVPGILQARTLEYVAISFSSA